MSKPVKESEQGLRLIPGNTLPVTALGHKQKKGGDQ